MSSKGADAVTDEQGALVPKLRFPGFSGAWDRTELTPHLEEHSERVPSTTLIPIYSSTRTGLKAQNEYFGGSNLANDGEYRIVPNGYFTFRHMSDDGTFKFNVNNTLDSIAVSKEYPVFKGVGLSPDFLLYILNNSADFAQFAQMQKKGGTRTRLYLSTLRTWKPLLPSIIEQQKIADCLSSIDTLITAEADKLDAMKDHKRGLMQQLFPAPGETTPRLRFPEFQDAGEWELKAISEIADLHKGKGISKLDISIDGNQPCIRYGELYTTYGEVIDETLSKTNLPLSELFMSKKNDVIIPSSGETKIDIATASCVMRDNIALGGDLNVIRSRQNGVFLSYFLNGPLKYEIAKVAQGDSVVHLYPTQIGLLRVAIPTTEEQQAIATCLSSIDTRIMAQSYKIDALEVHKGGLMQQLFPVAGEVQA